MIENVVIIGGGPAGYTAAIYAARAGLSPILLEGPQPGGQLSTTSHIENYPGFAYGIEALDLIEAWKEQAKNFGTRVKYTSVTGLRFIENPTSLKPILVLLENKEQIQTMSVIIATGASAKWLGIPGEDEYKNKGVSACATCDGWAFRGRDVAVIGGGDTAFEEALYLSKLCRKVYIIHRRDEFRASKIMIDRAVDKDNIYFILDATPVSFEGDGHKLIKVNYALHNKTKEALYLSKQAPTGSVEVSGAFVAIGHTPNTKFLDNSNVQIIRDKEGYILTNSDPNYSTTSVTVKVDEFLNKKLVNVFAAGDCVDRVYRQAITAAGEGCKAALDAERYLQSIL